MTAVDRAYAVTRAAYNLIDVEGIGPTTEARTLVEALAALHTAGEGGPDWKQFKAAREAFLSAATTTLRNMRGDD